MAKRVVLQSPAAVVTAAATQIGGVVPLDRPYDYATIYLDYTKGDETSVDVYPRSLDILGGIDAQWMEWSAAAGNKAPTVCTLRLTATGTYEYTYNVAGKTLLRFIVDATGGTPTGTLAATVILKEL